MKTPCLFCRSDNQSTVEHVIPESLGNDDLVLKDQVCKACNNHFSKLENFVLQKTPLAFWRVQLGIKTKRGKLPLVDLSQPNREKGVLPSTHPIHDDGIGFTSHDDGSTSVEIQDSTLIGEITNNKRSDFRFVMTPKMLSVFGRFLCKVGIELLCVENQHTARSARFEHVRRFARYGDGKRLWPIFHFTKGLPGNFRHVYIENDATYEEVECYAYNLFEFSNRYVCSYLRVGTDNWTVCLDDPSPTLKIERAFPGQMLHCIWYSPEEVG